MAVTVEDISKIIEDGNKLNHDIRVGDIMYILLLREVKEKNVVYASLFGKGFTDDILNKYDKSPKIKFLRKYIKTNYTNKKDSSDSTDVEQKYADMTFEENKDAMIKMIDDLKDALDDGRIEYKDYAKMVTDLRTKLNDKFSVSEKQDEQRIIVYKKYNDICVCGREIYRPTKDDIIEDLKKEYDLVPKNNKTEE